MSSSTVTITQTDPPAFVPVVEPTHFTLSREIPAIETATWTVSTHYPWQVNEDEVVHIPRRDENSPEEHSEEHSEEEHSLEEQDIVDFCQYARQFVATYCGPDTQYPTECEQWKVASSMCDQMLGAYAPEAEGQEPVLTEPTEGEDVVAENGASDEENNQPEEFLHDPAPTSLNVEALDPANKPVETPSPTLANSQKKYKHSPWNKHAPHGVQSPRKGKAGGAKSVDKDGPASSSATATVTEPIAALQTDSSNPVVGFTAKTIGIIAIIATLANLVI